MPLKIINVKPPSTPGQNYPDIDYQDDSDVFPAGTVMQVREYLKSHEPEFNGLTAAKAPMDQLISPQAPVLFVPPAGVIPGNMIATPQLANVAAPVKLDWELGTMGVGLQKNGVVHFIYHFQIARTKTPYKGQRRIIAGKFLWCQPMAQI